MSISPEEDAVHLSLHSLGIVPGLAQCLSPGRSIAPQPRDDLACDVVHTLLNDEPVHFALHRDRVIPFCL